MELTREERIQQLLAQVGTRNDGIQQLLVDNQIALEIAELKCEPMMNQARASMEEKYPLGMTPQDVANEIEGNIEDDKYTIQMPNVNLSADSIEGAIIEGKGKEVQNMLLSLALKVPENDLMRGAFALEMRRRIDKLNGIKPARMNIADEKSVIAQNKQLLEMERQEEAMEMRDAVIELKDEMNAAIEELKDEMGAAINELNEEMAAAIKEDNEEFQKAKQEEIENSRAECDDLHSFSGKEAKKPLIKTPKRMVKEALGFDER